MPQGTSKSRLNIYSVCTELAEACPELAEGVGFFEVPYSQGHASAGHKSIPNINLGSIAVSGDSRQTVVQF